MKSIFLTIIPAILFILTFMGAKLSPKGKFAPDFLCLEQARMIQAVCCMGVIIHHITQQVTVYGSHPKGPVMIFNYIGFLFTAIFFFFSGYGLLTSFNNKEDYLKHFLAKRLLAVLIPFWLINLVGVAINLIVMGNEDFFNQHSLNISTGIADIFRYILGISLIDDNGWFIIEIIIFYLLFYALFSMIGNKDLALGVMCVCVMALIVYSFFQGHNVPGQKEHWFRGEWWYNSTITFAFGMLFARFRPGIESFLKSHYKVFLPVFMVGAALVIYASCYAQDHIGYYHEKLPTYRQDAAITLFVQMLACIICTMFVLLLNMRVTIGNRVLGFVNSIQLPLFLFHGFMVKTVFENIEMNDLTRFAVVFAASIAGAWIISIPEGALVKSVIKFLTREKKVNDTLEGRAAKEMMFKRKQRAGKIAAAGIVAAFIGIPALIAGRSFFLKRQCEQEINAIKSAKQGDVVMFGRFDTDPARPGRERLEWIIAKREGNRICLLTEKGIAGGSYNAKHEKVTWAKSGLRAYLKEDPFAGMFSEAELFRILPGGDDVLTLLTPKEAEEIFASDKDRELAITRMAQKEGTNINTLSKAHSWDMKDYRSSWWWLKGGAMPSYTAPIVTADGEILLDNQEVNRPGGAIRPAVWVSVD